MTAFQWFLAFLASFAVSITVGIWLGKIFKWADTAPDEPRRRRRAF
jgi:hypothetical protein